MRHGSIMALREILTHQGASAGVFIPDLSSESLRLVEVDNSHNLGNATKRLRETVLDTQVSVCESEPNLKRQKSESDPNLFVSTVAVRGREMDPRVCLKFEDGSWSSTPGQVYGGLDTGPVKLEPETCLDGLNLQRKEVGETGHQKIYFDDWSSAAEMQLPSNLPEGCRLKKLLKLARHSWIKNWEFLQDCAIRLLSVLSLDRYAGGASFSLIFLGFF